MMSNVIPTAITVITGLFGLAGLAGGLVAYYKSKTLDQTLTILERTNKAQDDRIKFLEGESERQKVDLVEKQKAIQILTNVITGHEQLQTILEAITSHDERIIERDRKLFRDLEEILEILDILKSRVSLRDT